MAAFGAAGPLGDLRLEAVPLTDFGDETGEEAAERGAVPAPAAAVAPREWRPASDRWRERRSCRQICGVVALAGLGCATLYALANARGITWMQSQRTTEAYAGLGYQCGGKGWTGETQCAPGFVCEADSEDYSECKENSLVVYAEPYDYCKWRTPEGTIASQPCPETLTCTPEPGDPSGDRALCIPDTLQHVGEDCFKECHVPGGCLFCGAKNACCKHGAKGDPPECDGITHFLTSHYECVVPAQEVAVRHQGQDCWAACHMGGSCDWCGDGNACCRSGEENDPPECKGVTDFSAWDHHVCVKPVKAVAVQHSGEDCWAACGDKGGFCDFCGSGNACCRKGVGWPKECMGKIDYPRGDVHTCVKPVQAGCAPGMWEAGPSCIEPNKPISISFFVYSVNGGNADDLTNANVASLAGLFWYLHTQVVDSCPRLGGATKILRYKLTMHNPENLYKTEPHHRFGPYIDFGNATNCTSGKCNYYMEEFGNAVGCQPLSSSVAHYEPSPTLYSLPGSSCAREPDGSPQCTWRLEPAGELLMDELVGIEDHSKFCAIGNNEYDPMVDRGQGVHFWNFRNSYARCKWRIEQFQRLLHEKHPDEPVWIGEPTCDRPMVGGSEVPVGLNR